MTETVLLWAMAACGAVIAYAALTATNSMSRGQKVGLDRVGWSMTGMIGLWAAIQPFLDEPNEVTFPLVMMALSLAVQSWRLSKSYRS